MITKKNATDKSSKVQVNDLSLNKETVKDLNDSEAKGIQGGRRFTEGGGCSNPCPKSHGGNLCPHKSTVPAGCSPTVLG